LVRLVQRLFGMADMTRTLNELILVCRDSQEGFARAAQGIQNEHLKSRFALIARERADFVDELSNQVRQLGGEPASSSPANHRGWSELETRILAQDDASYLAECQAGEQNTLRHYEQALKRKVSPEVRARLETHRIAISRALEHLHIVEQVRTAITD
jgi:uncharacterized protein (TIGR02284 family)